MEPGIDAIGLLLEVIRENSPRSIWTAAPLEPFRRVENTNRGDIGEEFLYRYLTQAGFSALKSDVRSGRQDMRISGQSFEVKTASLGANNTFQFNHVRLDRDYRYLLCLGVCPDSIVFNAWRKGALAEGEAGRLVRMAEGQSITFKLTKRLADMLPIEVLPRWVGAEIRGDP